jgi:hypothetical protein
MAPLRTLTSIRRQHDQRARRIAFGCLLAYAITLLIAVLGCVLPLLWEMGKPQ